MMHEVHMRRMKVMNQWIMLLALSCVAPVMADSLTRLGCDGDVSQDGAVNADDVLAVIDGWGGEGFDVDGDGVTGVPELLLVLEEWQRPCHPFGDQVNVTFDFSTGLAIITASGLADHPMGPFDGSTGCFNPNTPTAQNHTWRIPMHPVVGNTSGEVFFDSFGKVGVMCNGVSFYNPFDAGGVDAPSTICMDEFNGHPSPDGQYHYHQAPDWGYGDGSSHSGVIGYSIDGYPVYGPFEAAGVFAKDISGVMALDECNGHEDPDRGYHYHSIAWEQDASGFPWIQGCWHGEPEVSNLQGGGPPGGPCDSGCGANMIPPPVCQCVESNPQYAYCCQDWDAACQAYAESVCGLP